MTPHRILLFAGFIAVVAAQQPPTSASFQKDVIYGRADAEELKLDIAQPSTGIAPFPALLCIHGGGWQLGDKQSYERVIRFFAGHGYVAAALDYRLTPRHRWPAQIEDVKCAIRFLRAHASELGIDPGRIAVLGDSAGGHLALMAGLTSAKDGLESPTCGDPKASSKVQAVVDFFGPSDLATMRVPASGEPLIIKSYGWDSNQVLFNLVGTKDRSAPVFRQVSPINYVDPSDPPVLIFHGNQDNLVPLEQSEILDRALTKAGVPHRLVIVEGGGRGWVGEKLNRSLAQAVEFLDDTLKH
jgi:acetyl esterase/lipase